MLKISSNWKRVLTTWCRIYDSHYRLSHIKGPLHEIQLILIHLIVSPLNPQQDLWGVPTVVDSRLGSVLLWKVYNLSHPLLLIKIDPWLINRLVLWNQCDWWRSAEFRGKIEDERSAACVHSIKNNVMKTNLKHHENPATTVDFESVIKNFRETLTVTL